MWVPGMIPSMDEVCPSQNVCPSLMPPYLRRTIGRSVANASGNVSATIVPGMKFDMPVSSAKEGKRNRLFNTSTADSATTRNVRSDSTQSITKSKLEKYYLHYIIRGG